MKKIIGTGLNGLIGTRIVNLLSDTYTFENISRSTGVNITNKEQILSAIVSSDAAYVLHLTAKTDVDSCEQDKEQDIKILENNDSLKLSVNELTRYSDQFKDLQSAWAINVYGTQNIVEACQKGNKKLLYVSTDYVFDGDKPPVGGYSEEDTPNPINWYALTKFKGEEIVRNSGIQYIIIRPAYPYGIYFEKKKDFVQAILSRFAEGKKVSAVTDQKFTPTFIDDIAFALNKLISVNSEGIYHVVGSQALSPYDASLLIAKMFGYDVSLVQKTIRSEYFKNRAPRPYNLYLRNDKIERLGMKMKGFQEGLQELKK